MDHKDQNGLRQQRRAPGQLHPRGSLNALGKEARCFRILLPQHGPDASLLSKLQKRCLPTRFFARLLALWWRLLYRSRPLESLPLLGDEGSNHETKTTFPLTFWNSLDPFLKAAVGNHASTADICCEQKRTHLDRSVTEPSGRSLTTADRFEVESSERTDLVRLELTQSFVESGLSFLREELKR